jgi:hypothetical protein
LGLVEAKQIEELTDLVIELRRVPHRDFSIQGVVVPAPDPLACDVAPLDEIRDYPLGGPLSDPDRGRDVSKPDRRVLLEAQKHLCVARDEAPLCSF